MGEGKWVGGEWVGEVGGGVCGEQDQYNMDRLRKETKGTE